MGLLCVRVAVLCLLLLGSSELGLELSDLLVLLGLLDHDLLGLLGLGLIVALHTLTDILDGRAEGLAELRQVLGPEDNQDNDENNDELSAFGIFLPSVSLHSLSLGSNGRSSLSIWS